ncbi:Two-component response regulator SSK1p [Knufia obscura]|uniref:Two-component response regulator SSK1p n=2 Tax=Knufia TaxID=430999 RepID=A0AAN8EAI2_9EURO|nr:Two-component response regulator SSK1p [Knufia obscura]KAK5950619.1 Two-component response regulator SSK1p [Knufia fluminis]
MLLREITRSLKSIIRLPRSLHNAVAGAPEAPETVEASGAPSARPQALTAEDTAHQKHHHQVTSTELYAPSEPERHEAAADSSTSRNASFAQSQASLPESTDYHSSHQNPAYGPETLAEKHIYVREVELSTSSSAQVNLLPATPECATEPELPPGWPLPAPSPALSPTQSAPSDDELEIMQKKIWVKRPGASATLVAVNDDDLVDTVRDVILRKYANSLGRSIDSPDITLKIVSREQANKSVPQDRVLGPDESIIQALDSYYPGGQTIDEALVIDVAQRRTPKPSPRIGSHHPAIAYPYYVEDHRPGDGAREYFPPMAVHSPHLAQPNGPHLPHSIGILATGQAPPLPSPGGHSTRKHRDGRPKYVRQHTSSPTIMHSSQPHSNDLKPQLPNGTNPPAPLPTPPVQMDHRPSITPPNRTSSPHPGRSTRKNKTSQQRSAKSINGEPLPSKLAPAGLLDAQVPPINVLIVEDNVINLRLLEQFMRRLKVRWKSAMNGREAVNTWRTGGFHLVLMDIQLPVMSGLEATKEIRRLESVNGIGLGLSGGQSADGKQNGSHEINTEDKLHDMNLFKSPVIIVALTASSLQSDRHEALAVGCNDFLTKPVGFPWMSRKVTEWGCMQALIDFDGWRQWKATVEKKDEGLSEEQKKAKDKEEKAKRKAALTAMFTAPPPSTRDKKEEGKSEAGGKSPVNGGPNAPPRGSRRGASGSAGAPVLETHEEESEE